MTASTLCFISSKGGSGKTVTSSAIGTFLAELGFSVLLVDTDAATNGMTLLLLERWLGQRQQKSDRPEIRVGLFDWIDGAPPTKIEISEKLHFIPASFSMKDTEKTDIEHFEKSLTVLLEDSQKYDFVLLDAQAGIDNFARTAAKLADQCVIVSEYDPVSAQGIERLKILFSSVLEISATWVLFNKILPEFAAAIGEGLSIARYLNPIPWDADVVRAFVRRDLAIEMSRPNPYTMAISQIAYSLFPDQSGEAIENWRSETFQSISSPIFNRLKQIDKMRSKILYASKKAETLNAISGLIVAGIGLAFASIGALSLRGSTEVVKYVDQYIGFLFTDRGQIATAPLFIVGVCALFYPIISRLSVGRRRSELDIATLKLVEEERAKLTASLEAAEGTLRLNRDAGVFERRRREPLGSSGNQKQI